MVARDPERSRSAADVAACTALAEAPIAAGLRDLAASGVLEEATSDGDPTYRVRSDTTEQRGLMQELVTAFDRVPVQLIRAVYSRPSDPVQSFADAFRIQRRK